MTQFKYLAGYPQTVLQQVQRLLDSNQLRQMLQTKYPDTHLINTDKALYGYAMTIKNQYLRQSAPLNKVVYDDKLDVLHQALGLHSVISRVQGGNLKSKNEIRIGAVFKTAPLAFLNMITVHELAHLREKQHNKAFYKLCEYMLPDYHQLEFDTRLYLTYLDSQGKLY